MTAVAVRRALRLHATPERAAAGRRYFRTGPGEYGEGDEFLGVTVPAQRVVARAFRGLPLAEALALLRSKVHEERLWRCSSWWSASVESTSESAQRSCARTSRTHAS